MNEDGRTNSNYNDPMNNSEYNQRDEYNNNQYRQSYMPNQYNYNERGYTDSFYDDYEDSGAGSFLFGAIVGGIIGAAAALFLAPKTGKEMRDDFSTQAGQLKEKGIEISAVAKDKATEYSAVARDKASEYSAIAKDKATEFTSAAKVKTEEVTKTLQEQSEQLVDKVKSMKAKTKVPMDDGTVSSEGEEATQFVEKVSEQVEDSDDVTITAEAIKEAVIKSDSN